MQNQPVNPNPKNAAQIRVEIEEILVDAMMGVIGNEEPITPEETRYREGFIIGVQSVLSKCFDVPETEILEYGVKAVRKLSEKFFMNEIAQNMPSVPAAFESKKPDQ